MTPFATYIVETFVTLLAVVALAIVVLVGARRFGIGRALGPLELIGRLPLEGRRTVYLVRVQQRVFVLGASEAGLEKIAELDALPLSATQDSRTTFRQALAQALDRSQGRTPNEPTPGGTDAQS